MCAVVGQSCVGEQKEALRHKKMETVNYVAQLQEYARNLGAEPLYDFLGTEGPDHDKTFIMRVVLNGEVYPEGVGKTKKKAKQKAAENALQSLLVNKNASEERRSQSVNSKDNSFAKTNFIGLVNHFCQEKKFSHSYILDKRHGQSHIPLFFYKLVIDNKEHSVGEGKTATEAKQNAAQLAWLALQEQSKDAPLTFTSLDSGESSSKSDSSNPLKAQASSSLSVSENDAPASLSTPSWQESIEQLTQSNATDASDRGIFTDSSKPKVAVKNNSMGNSVSNTSTHSRFTSEFESITCLGNGAFGSVYKAREKMLDMYYAVKVVHGTKKALREVKALSDLLHNNIVRYYDCWMEDTEYEHDSSANSRSSSHKSPQYLYIKMELCKTKTLEGWINERNAITQRDSKRRVESVFIAQQIVNGVEYIHSKKLIHRDLKPANVMFGQDGGVKIGDFGLVTADADDENVMERTIEMGTLSYMPPEQKTEKTYNRKVDIFAFGLIYLELLWKVSSGHERALLFRDARSQKFPMEFPFFGEKQIIKSTLCGKPEQRPEASEVKAELEKLDKTLNTQHQQNASV